MAAGRLRRRPELLDCRLYHQAHHRASHGGFPQTDWKRRYQRYEETLSQGPSRQGSPMVVNLPDWGLANEVLPEWQASPGLVQVQVLTSEVEARPFGNSLDAAENAQRTSGEKLSEAETSPATTRSDLNARRPGWRWPHRSKPSLEPLCARRNVPTRPSGPRFRPPCTRRRLHSDRRLSFAASSRRFSTPRSGAPRLHSGWPQGSCLRR